MKTIQPFLREELAIAAGEDAFDWVEKIARAAPTDAIYRAREGRVTLRFDHAGRAYFLKLHRGVGWFEIIKNLLGLRLPVLGADNEYRAVLALEQLGVATMAIAGFGSRGSNPARRQSFIVTEELTGTITLEDYCADWLRNPPTHSVKKALIEAVATSARTMHAAGINHRDFYLCHFHLDPVSLSAASGPRCHLIDLHRAQLRVSTPRRWQIKDIAGLYFSALDSGLTRRDLLRFMRAYSAGSAGAACGTESEFWRAVVQRAEKLYLRDHGRTPPSAWREPSADQSFERAFLRDAQMIKAGTSSSVGLLAEPGGKSLYVKHYRARSLGQRLGLALGLSRAQRCYRVGGAMRKLGLPVAKPVRLVVVRTGAALPWGCYYVGEALAGSDLRSLCLGAGIAANEQKLTLAGLELARLHEAGFVHGDCKWSNIFFCDDGLFWLDLDNAGQYRQGRAARDVARFVVNAEDFNASRDQLDGFLRAYSHGRGMEMETLGDWMARPLAKLRRRHRETYGERGQTLIKPGK